MADPKKPTDALVDNFDDLLDLTADDTPVTEAPADTAPEDPEEARIRELEAMLSPRCLPSTSWKSRSS